MKKATIIVLQEDSYNSLYKTLFKDVMTDPNVFFVEEKPFPDNGFYRYLPSRKLKKMTFGLSNKLYCNYYNLPTLIKELRKKYDHISVLMHNACLIKPRYPLEVIETMKKEASLNLLYLDVYEHSWSCAYANYLFENDVFEKVFTFNPVDAQKYKMILINTPYSLPIKIDKRKAKSHMYFCGTDAGRMFMLYQIWKEAKRRGLSLNYDLSYADGFKDFFEGDSNIRFSKFTPYEKVINNILESSCILDIVKKDQLAYTVRPYEAVVYNKKLLTNNKSIFDFKYYNENYMQYFEKVEDINWDWIREDFEVNYNYQNDFSPKYLLEQLS